MLESYFTACPGLGPFLFLLVVTSGLGMREAVHKHSGCLGCSTSPHIWRSDMHTQQLQQVIIISACWGMTRLLFMAPKHSTKSLVLIQKHSVTHEVEMQFHWCDQVMTSHFSVIQN